jgi:glycerophosphoryl diester phosphodiesterase
MYRNTNCRLQAHRGVCTEAPENTMAAFRLAVAQGYDIIEFDPKMTKDNVPIVLHDRTLNRTGRVAGKAFEQEVKIKDLTLAELADVDVGAWFDKSYTGEHIPTLSQALDYMKMAGIPAKVDNVVQSFTPEQQEIVFDVIERHGGTVGLTCSDLALLRRYATRFPTAPLHYDGPTDKESLDELESFAKGHETYVWIRQDNKRTAWCKVPPVTRELADMVHARGYLLGIWILGDDAEMADALQYGADVVETTGGIKP